MYSGTYIYRTSNENILVKCDTYVVRFYMYLIPQIYFLLLFISQNILQRITFIDSKNILDLYDCREQVYIGGFVFQDVHDDFCGVCNQSGQLLLCDTCSKVYHLQCLDPPLSAIPEGRWSCPKCQVRHLTGSYC